MTRATRRLLATIAVLLAVLPGCGEDGGSVPLAPASDREPGPEVLRAQMVETLRERGITDEKVLDAMGRVERHRFVPVEVAHEAYDVKSLPIGSGQTISSPYLVALMTELLELKGGERVLEIGTGSGYQAAVLAEIVPEVLSMELREKLANTARQRLRKLGYDNVEVVQGDGWKGRPESAPFDAIVVTAAPDEVPQALVDQLALGGRMVVPLGEWPANQMLTRIRKDSEGVVTSETKKAVVWFGPMIRDD